MSVAMILLIGLPSIFAGALIGMIGIGGVLLVPLLVYVAGFSVHEAIPACVMSYLFSGIVGAVMFARRGSIRWPMVGWLCAGAMPGAYLGAATVSVTSSTVLEFVIALFIVFSGINALRTTGPAEQVRETIDGKWLVLIGIITGYSSALTGTGGPLVLVPIMVWLKLPVLAAVGLGQAIQLPIAVLATIGNFAYGEVNLLLAGIIAVALMIGVVIGVRVAHSIPARLLKRIVAVVLVTVGFVISLRLGYQVLTGA